MAQTHRKNRATALFLFSIAGGMVGLSFAAVPLYQLFCQVTGFGGTTKIAAAPPPASGPASGPEARLITVRFDANVNPALPWRFAPEQRQVQVRVGETMQINYKALNLSDGPATGTATFNVTPYKAGKYFSKIECFCFTEQRLAGGEEVLMGVQFFVDPEIFNDPNARDVRTITLSYTFFPAPEEKGSGSNKTAGRASAGPGKS